MRITPAANPYTRFSYPANVPADSGLIEWNYDPATALNNTACTSGTYYVLRLPAQVGGSISKITMGLNTLGTSLTAATNATISNCANNGSGLIRVTTSGAHGYSTNDVITIASVVGTTEANSAWVITVIDATNFDLVGSTFTNAYSSGGTATRSQNCVALYDSTGAFLTCTGDQVATWASPGSAQNLAMSFAKAVTLAAGSNYYAQVLSVASVSAAGFIRAAGALGNNIGQTGATLKFSTNGTSKTKQSNTITPSGLTTTSIISFWFGLS